MRTLPKTSADEIKDALLAVWREDAAKAGRPVTSLIIAGLFEEVPSYAPAGNSSSLAIGAK